MCVRIFQQDHTFFSHTLTEQTSTSYLDPDRQNTSEQSGIANHISYDSTLESYTWFRRCNTDTPPTPPFFLSSFLIFKRPHFASQSDAQTCYGPPCSARTIALSMYEVQTKPGLFHGVRMVRTLITQPSESCRGRGIGLKPDRLPFRPSRKRHVRHKR